MAADLADSTPSEHNKIYTIDKKMTFRNHPMAEAPRQDSLSDEFHMGRHVRGGVDPKQ
jgi:hypothetical protein